MPMTTSPGSNEQAPPQSEVLVWVLSADGEAEFFSPSWLAFTGHSQKHCIGSGWLADVHRDERSLLAAAIESAIKAKRGFRQAMRLHRADGEYVWYGCEGIVRLDATGGFVGLIGVCSDITRQIRESTAAELSGRHFVDLLPQTDMIALALDNSGRTLYFNQALAEALGCPAEEFVKAQCLSRFLDRQHVPLSETLFPEGQRSAHFPARIESEFIEGREGRHVLLWHVIPLRDYGGQSSGLILVGEDLTDKRSAEDQLRLTARVFEMTDLAMIITDQRGTILSANGAFSKLSGYSIEEAIGSNPRMLQSGRHDQTFYRTMWQTIHTEGNWQGEIWDKRKDGTVYPKFLSIAALRNEQDEVTHYSGVFYDISERKAVEARLDRLAHFDALTELPNRLFLLDKLSMACHATAAQKQNFAVLFLDLDRFKEINDTLGHEAGDDLLRITAKRLRESIRSHDVAARIGGDEFVVMLNDIKGPNNAAMVAQKIIESFAEPLTIAGQPVAVTVSIGIALCPDDAGDPETLLRLADQAMYRAKAAGRNSYRFHGKH
jgi:diguanylate cyclase (GGDEF)-like protein/PAS domain S-box-containing protein